LAISGSPVAVYEFPVKTTGATQIRIAAGTGIDDG
jgi:hypothetical protein